MNDLQVFIEMLRFLYGIISWRPLTNLLGFVGFFLGILSIMLAYWGVRLAKKSREAVIDALHCKAFIVKIENNHYIFAQVVLRNLGRAWLKLLPLMRTWLMATSRDWWQHFDLEDYIFNSQIWNIASRKFEFAINCQNINNNPETILYPDGSCVAFYFTGKCDYFWAPEDGVLKRMVVKIPFFYTTEKGILKFNSIMIEKYVPLGKLESKTPAFVVKVPVTFEVDRSKIS